VSGFLLALLVTFSGGALAAGITGTKHDLSISGGGTIKSSDQTEICVFCHTPHAALKNDNIPLWNHALSAQTYGVYTSPTIDATDLTEVGGINESTAAVSNLCLSCHDGSLAVNSLNNPSNARPDSTFAGDGKIPVGATNLGFGADALKNDHPVNFTYDATLYAADPTLQNPASLAGVKLFSNKVQCASCHDPHTSADPTGSAFLRVSMSASTLCFACHNK
jgi:predicted CXXCH cytochrome family protein